MLYGKGASEWSGIPLVIELADLSESLYIRIYYLAISYEIVHGWMNELRMECAVFLWAARMHGTFYAQWSTGKPPDLIQSVRFTEIFPTLPCTNLLR
jgi:hypothetical protein